MQSLKIAKKKRAMKHCVQQAFCKAFNTELQFGNQVNSAFVLISSNCILLRCQNQLILLHFWRF